jgi:bifunctional oligoribonuclease and PAP phosphatase NrnA
MDKITSEIMGAKKIAIAGHIRPDGDCIGSCTALSLYLNQIKKEFKLDQIDVYLENFGNEYDILSHTKEIKHSYETDESYDLFISLDCGSMDRLGNSRKFFDSAQKTINIDHHISNSKFADINHVVPTASSTCEVLYSIMDDELISKEIAEALYLGIIHDTGVFKHSNTSEYTMQVAGRLISKGINFSVLIDETFYAKTYMQNQILGRCLMESILVLNKKVAVASMNRKMLDFYGASSGDLDGIIDQLRVTKGAEVAVFIYEIQFHEFRVSLRSNGAINVNKIAVYFGGGGHIKAAGCTMNGTVHDVINNLTPHIEAQLKELNLLY